MNGSAYVFRLDHLEYLAGGFYHSHRLDIRAAQRIQAHVETEKK